MAGIYRYEAHFISVITGINDKSTKQSLSVYPNPAQNQITIEATTGEPFSIMDSRGQEVLTGKLAGSPITMDISGLASGYYIVRTISTEGIRTGSFIKK
jgi:hypothetical protein